MYKLLNAGFSRLMKNKIFLSVIIITIVFAICSLIFQYDQEVRFSSFGPSSSPTEKLLLNFVVFIIFFIALFISLFVGTEYSDGTIRNKIIAGHSRKNIYLSNLIISITVGILIELLYLLIISLIAIPLFGGIDMPLNEFGFLLLDTIVVIITYCSIFNFISLICSSITISTTICMLLTIVLMLMAILSQTGSILLNILPSGQALQIAWEVLRVDANIESMSLYLVALFTIINSLGIYLFNIKEIK